MNNVLIAFPITTNHFVKAPATKMFRPILHIFDGQLAVHTQTVEDGVVELIGGEYFGTADVCTAPGRQRLSDALLAYSARHQEYMRHLSLVTIRMTEDEAMGLEASGVALYVPPVTE